MTRKEILKLIFVQSFIIDDVTVDILSNLRAKYMFFKFEIMLTNIVHFLECFITSCDYRVRYVHHGVEEDSVESAEEDGANSGFRLWSSGPNFDTDLPQDVTGVVGHTAYLTCRVFDRTNSTVSVIKLGFYVMVDLLGKGIILFFCMVSVICIEH